MRRGAARRVVASSRAHQRFARTALSDWRPPAVRPPTPLQSRTAVHGRNTGGARRASLIASDTPGRASLRRSEPRGRSVHGPRLAFTPWVVGGPFIPPVQAGQMTVWRAFVIRWQSCSVRWARAAHPSESSQRWTRCAARRSVRRRSGHGALACPRPQRPDTQWSLVLVRRACARQVAWLLNERGHAIEYHPWWLPVTAGVHGGVRRHIVQGSGGTHARTGVRTTHKHTGTLTQRHQRLHRSTHQRVHTNTPARAHMRRLRGTPRRQRRVSGGNRTPSSCRFGH
jgi:hypothetical protein